MRFVRGISTLQQVLEENEMESVNYVEWSSDATSLPLAIFALIDVCNLKLLLLLTK